MVPFRFKLLVSVFSVISFLAASSEDNFYVLCLNVAFGFLSPRPNARQLQGHGFFKQLKKTSAMDLFSTLSHNRRDDIQVASCDPKPEDGRSAASSAGCRMEFLMCSEIDLKRENAFHSI